VQLGLEASNRRDLEAAFALYHADIESRFQPELVSLGFEPVYRGRQQRLVAVRTWRAELGESRFATEELIDLGDGRLLVVGRIQGSGLASGATFDSDWALLLTLSHGLVLREQVFFNRHEALTSVGLTA
jgi:ketosteroid isomerase-like protein